LKEESNATGNAEVVVRTIKKESRGFVRARYAANLRRREVVGSVEVNSSATAPSATIATEATSELPHRRRKRLKEENNGL
jgi:hypothetical protein